MSWVAWKQTHLWSGAPGTTCYSSGWSTYCYNCRWLNQNVMLLSYIRVFPSIWSEKKYVFQLILFKNTCVYIFLWIAIHWVCRIDTNRSDKISVHRDAPVNRYTPTLCKTSVSPLLIHWRYCSLASLLEKLIPVCCYTVECHYNTVQFSILHRQVLFNMQVQLHTKLHKP